MNELDDYVRFYIFSFVDAEYNYSYLLDELLLRNKEYTRHVKYCFQKLSTMLVQCFSPLYYLYFISVPRKSYSANVILSSEGTSNTTSINNITSPYFYDFSDYIKYFKQFDDSLISYKSTHIKHKFTPRKYSRLVNSLMLC